MSDSKTIKCVHLSANLIDRASVRGSVIASGAEYSFVKSLQGLLLLEINESENLVFFTDVSGLLPSELEGLANFFKPLIELDNVKLFSYASHVEIDVFKVAQKLGLKIEARSAFFKKIPERLI